MLISDLTDVVALYGSGAEPERVALEQDGRAATMRELAGWMGSAAAALADGSDDPVAISSPDVIEHTVAYLGALAAGRRPLLVDPKQPQQLLEDTAAQVGARISVGRPVPGVPHLSFDELVERPPRERARVPPQRPGALLMTSGSTGDPKIVVRSRGADLAAACNFRLARFPISEGDRFWLFAPYTGSPWAGVAWGVLLARATVVVAPFGIEDIGAFLERRRITGTYLGPTATRLAYEREGLEGRGWDRLTAVLSGGEKLDPATARLMVERWPGAVRLGYGSTEVTMTAMTGGDRELLERPGTVGRPVPLHQAVIADPDGGEPLPAGQEGEVLVRGHDMFLGYLGEAPAGEWYRSGDLGRFDEDGCLYITGRASSLVQVGGNRLSTDEVAAKLAEHPALASAVVMAVDDPTWTTRLVAFVVPEPGAQTDPGALDRWIRDRLPAYKVPRAIVRLDELPQDSSGKLARRTLQRLAEEAGT